MAVHITPALEVTTVPEAMVIPPVGVVDITETPLMLQQSVVAVVVVVQELSRLIPLWAAMEAGAK